MHNLTRTLLSGTALAALAAAPSVASNAPEIHIQALHAGKQVNKTVLHNSVGGHTTYTIGVSTSVLASDLHKTVPLALTFYKWSSSESCSNPRQKIKAPKKSLYGKIKTGTESYSLSCPAPTVFYGDSYKLTDASGEGKTDSFVSILYGWYVKPGGIKYKGTLYSDVSVAIGSE
jgi:hypothetical protein